MSAEIEIQAPRVTLHIFVKVNTELQNNFREKKIALYGVVNPEESDIRGSTVIK